MRYRVQLDSEDGYEDFDSLADAQEFRQEWQDNYGEETATIIAFSGQ